MSPRNVTFSWAFLVISCDEWMEVISDSKIKQFSFYFWFNRTMFLILHIYSKNQIKSIQLSITIICEKKSDDSWVFPFIFRCKLFLSITTDKRSNDCDCDRILFLFTSNSNLMIVYLRNWFQQIKLLITIPKYSLFKFYFVFFDKGNWDFPNS